MNKIYRLRSNMEFKKVYSGGKELLEQKFSSLR